MATVEVVDGGRFLTGVAVPFDEPALVNDRTLGVVHEVFDEQSVPISRRPRGVPLLISHDQTRPPVGRVDASEIVVGRGLTFTAELVGTEEETEGWRRRWAAGLMFAISIGFHPSPRDDEHYRPERDGLPPVVVRRNVRIAELSIVLHPAFRSARIDRVADRRPTPKLDGVLADIAANG
ncbi:hypothetical protein BJF85_02820 [Saccharomonospora sp. CUA-673]|nr:hypothetical protein BJF85_02820 [Saccharomonospora sp. CUA-673]